MSVRFRWNAEASAWEFFERGVWNVLREGTHISTPPMTFDDGIRHLLTGPCLWHGQAGQREVGWLHAAARRLEIDYFSGERAREDGARAARDSSSREREPATTGPSSVQSDGDLTSFVSETDAAAPLPKKPDPASFMCNKATGLTPVATLCAKRAGHLGECVPLQYFGMLSLDGPLPRLSADDLNELVEAACDVMKHVIPSALSDNSFDRYKERKGRFDAVVERLRQKGNTR